MNAERVTERGFVQGALTEMHNRKLGSYQHGGVELVLVPGDEKLRVRVRDEATVSAEPPSDSGGDDGDDDQGGEDLTDMGEQDGDPFETGDAE